MKINIKNLKILRNYIESGEWQEYGEFDMRTFWERDSISEEGEYLKPCGCLIGLGKFAPELKQFHNMSKYSEGVIDHHAFTKTAFNIDIHTKKEHLWEFLFANEWHRIDNTPAGAVGRIDAVIAGLRFESKILDQEYYK